MNIQEFSNLKAGDMVKVKCPICHDCGHYYIGRIVVKIDRYGGYPYGTWAHVVTIDAIGCNGVEFDKTDIVRKIEKPEKRTAYWCKTRDEAENFLEDCEAWGIRWCMGEDATKFSNWKLGKNGVGFYLHERIAFVNGDNCITWSDRTHDKPDEYDYTKYDIDRYIEYPSGKVLWDRAEEEAKKKAAEPVSFKVRCVWKKNEADRDFTVGKIYEWKNGGLTDDTGFTFRDSCRYPSIDMWKFSSYKFVKVDEEELKAEETLAEAINNLGKAATLAEAWAKFAKIYADTDSVKCCCKNKCCSCANYKPAVKEVKRPAKAGEYIKIVAEFLSCGKYTNGDIGLVTMSQGSANKVTINGYDDVPVGRWEYVVLENYIPEVKEVKRPAKAGEYIKIIKPLYTFNEVGDILKVNHIRCSGGVDVRVEDHPRDASKPTWWGGDPDSWYYGPDKYVVLENYRP